VITGPQRTTPRVSSRAISLLGQHAACVRTSLRRHAIQVALGGHQSIEDLVLPGGRLLEQRDVAWTKLNDIPGVSCVKPEGRACTPSRGSTPRCTRSPTDEQLVLDLLLQEKILVTPGHRLQLADAGSPSHRDAAVGPATLANAIERLGNFLASYPPIAMVKRRLVDVVHRIVNPVARTACRVRWFLETTGRISRQPRRTPIAGRGRRRRILVRVDEWRGIQLRSKTSRRTTRSGIRIHGRVAYRTCTSAAR